MESPNFQLEIFEGPLDLLLTLIAKNKVDIYDIPIALILDQYMAYLDEMRRLDMEIAGDFIVMAAELMLIKSRMLLPKPPSEEEPEEDPRAKLARTLIEYRRAKEAAVFLSEQYETYAGRIIKDTDVIDRSKLIPESVDARLLGAALERLVRRNSELPRLAKESENEIRTLLKARVVPVSEKVVFVMRQLYKQDLIFDDLFIGVTTRSELVATFIAVLELVKVQRVTVSGDDGENVILHLNKNHERNASLNE
ncbi:MAG: segregation/condensation protein A [Firmicutes bacterium]|nr:segregation/condensation protein A [Bacillota bacterium]